MVLVSDTTPADDIKASYKRENHLAIESAFTGPIQGMDETTQNTTRELLKVWRDKYPRNILRTSYYLAHEGYKGIAYSIPNQMKTLAKPMVGWPNKAVRALADLSVFEGFDAPDGIRQQVDDLCEANMLDVKVSQGIVSAYTHGCSFLTVSRTGGEVHIIPRSADWSAALWDWEHGRIAAALTITDKDKDGYITGFRVWMPHATWDCRRNSGQINPHWQAEPLATGFDRPSVVPLVCDEQLNRPFGSSRITRPLMALTDFALRTLVRMEANAEFYAAPRIWFLGTNKGQVSPDTWSSIMSVINGVPANKNGDKPDMRQLNQASMQPHDDMLRSIALMVAAETDIPPTDLGITIDNPASAEAMAEAERKLSRTADRQNRRFGRALKDALAMALEDTGTDPTAIRELRALWAPTKETSDAQRADYYSKVASVNPNFADSDVGLTRAGLTWDEIKAQRAYEKQKRTEQSVDQLRAQLHLAQQTEEASDVTAAQQTQQPAAGQPQPSAA